LGSSWATGWPPSLAAEPFSVLCQPSPHPCCGGPRASEMPASHKCRRQSNAEDTTFPATTTSVPSPEKSPSCHPKEYIEWDRPDYTLALHRFSASHSRGRTSAPLPSPHRTAWPQRGRPQRRPYSLCIALHQRAQCPTHSSRWPLPGMNPCRGAWRNGGNRWVYRKVPSQSP
jgi:hypothetical protein